MYVEHIHTCLGTELWSTVPVFSFLFISVLQMGHLSRLQICDSYFCQLKPDFEHLYWVFYLHCFTFQC